MAMLLLTFKKGKVYGKPWEGLYGDGVVRDAVVLGGKGVVAATCDNRSYVCVFWGMVVVAPILHSWFCHLINAAVQSRGLLAPE